MNKKLRRNESGVALLFALGLLALMILLCVSFSMESLQSQKAAANNGNRSAAKVLAMSAVNHASMTILQYQNQQFEQAPKNYLRGTVPKNLSNTPTLGNPYDFSAIVSHGDSSVPANVKNDQLDKLLPLRSPYAGAAQVSSTNSYLGWYSQINGGDDKRNPSWVYVREGNESTDPIVGRFAYRVLPPASSTQINLAYFLRGKQELSTSTQKSNAGLLSEISQLDLTGSEFEAMRPASTSTKPIVGSFELFSGANKSKFYDSNGKLNSKKYDAIQRIFSDGVMPGDIEAFKLEKGNKVWHLHRYNLAQNVVVGSSANTDVKKIKALSNSGMVLTPYFLYSLTGESVQNGSSAQYDKYYLTAQNNNMTPFFFGMIADDNRSFDSLTSRKAQIAANFLDYCDNNDDPTSDSTDWATTAPTYTGNEKTLYINELAYGIKVASSVADNRKVQLAFTPTMFAELIDIYGKISAAGYTLTGGVLQLTFNVSGEVTQIQKIGDTADKQTASYKISSTEKSVRWSGDGALMTIENFSGLRYAAGYKTGNSISLDDSDLLNFSAIPADYEISEYNIKITDLRITFNERLHLKNGTHNADYTRLPKDQMAVENSTVELKDSSANKYWLIGNMSVKDPRQNLNVRMSYNTANAVGDSWKACDWVFDPKVINSDGSADVDALGVSKGDLSMTIKVDSTAMTPVSASGLLNPYSDPSKPVKENSGLRAYDVTKDVLKSDIEKTEDPAATDSERISTAYIANKPMESFWELGMIHRGAIWETINLQKSSVTPESIFNYITSDKTTPFTGSSYVDGDAYILDMVKLSPAAVSYGLFDINMLRSNYPGFDYVGAGTDSDIFAEILSNLKKHNDPDTFNGGVADTKAADLAQKIIDSAKNDTNEFLARSDIAEHFFKVFNEENDETLTDARREEIIAKTMPLLKAEPALVTVFHVDIVAQTIKDIGGFKVSKIDEDGKLVESSGETKLGTLDYENGIYFDDITGQVKMRATFDCNPYTGRVKLRQIRYLD